MASARTKPLRSTATLKNTFSMLSVDEEEPQVSAPQGPTPQTPQAQAAQAKPAARLRVAPPPSKPVPVPAAVDTKKPQKMSPTQFPSLHELTRVSSAMGAKPPVIGAWGSGPTAAIRAAPPPVARTSQPSGHGSTQRPRARALPLLKVDSPFSPFPAPATTPIRAPSPPRDDWEALEATDGGACKTNEEVVDWFGDDL